jgi:transposase-like protein
MFIPKTLQEAIVFYSDSKNCIAVMREQRWPDGKVVCPTCGRNDVTWQENAKVWQCKSKHSQRKFSAKTGTIYEDSPLGLDKWLMATWMLANCKNGISSYEVASSIGVTQKSAWFMMHRIRLAMKDDSTSLMGGPGSGPVEVDEAFIGGKIQNMHKGRAEDLRMKLLEQKMDGYENRVDNKTPVVGIFERSTRQVRANVIPNVKRDTLQREILKNVKHGSQVFTDQAIKYNHLREQFVHATVNHAERYVDGQVHTNCLENFWSLTKRNLSGTYVAVEPFHLDRYLDEMTFRFNRRNMTAGQRFAKVLSQVTGKRLTYAEVTGKVQETAF